MSLRADFEGLAELLWTDTFGLRATLMLNTIHSPDALLSMISKKVQHYETTLRDDNDSECDVDDAAGDDANDDDDDDEYGGDFHDIDESVENANIRVTMEDIRPILRSFDAVLKAHNTVARTIADKIISQREKKP